MGKLVGGMLGFSREPGALQSESAAGEFESLYIAKPKVYVADEGALQGWIAQQLAGAGAQAFTRLLTCY